MGRVLVQFKDNWADEMNLHGLAIMTDEQFQILTENAHNLSYAFGSNEAFEPGELSRSSFKVVSSIWDDIAVVEKLLQFTSYGPYKTWGNFPECDDCYED